MDREIKAHLSWAKKLLGVFILIKVLLALNLELGNDEVYYVMYARHLDWGYFDHPPMIAFFIYLSTFFGFLEWDLCIRLSSILATAFSSYLLFKALLESYGRNTAWIYLIGVNVSVYFAVISGFFVMPDAPMMFFYQLCFWAFLKYLRGGAMKYWIWMGVFCGGSIFSKYHGVFLPFGLGVYVLLKQRSLLKAWQTYMVPLGAFLALAAIFLWNYLNDFASFAYHGDRVGAAEQSIRWDYILRELMGELVYIGPWIVALLVFSFFYKKQNKDGDITVVALANALPLLAFIFYMAMERPTLPHWSGPAWMSLILLMAVQLKHWDIRIKRWIIASFAFYFVLMAALVYINFLAPAMTADREENRGEQDFTLDLYGWRQSAPKVRDLMMAASKGESFAMVTDFWFPAAHVERYFNTPFLAPHIVLGEKQDIHAFEAWENHNFVEKEHYYYLTSSRLYRAPEEKLGNAISKSLLIGKIPVERGRNIVAYFFVYEVSFK